MHSLYTVPGSGSVRILPLPLPGLQMLCSFQLCSCVIVRKRTLVSFSHEIRGYLWPHLSWIASQRNFFHFPAHWGFSKGVGGGVQTHQYLVSKRVETFVDATRFLPTPAKQSPNTAVKVSGEKDMSYDQLARAGTKESDLCGCHGSRNQKSRVNG